MVLEFYLFLVGTYCAMAGLEEIGKKVYNRFIRKRYFVVNFKSMEHEGSISCIVKKGNYVNQEALEYRIEEAYGDIGNYIVTNIFELNRRDFDYFNVRSVSDTLDSSQEDGREVAYSDEELVAFQVSKNEKPN